MIGSKTTKKPEKSFYDAVYRAVSLVPEGKVFTYGGIASLLLSPRNARAVGYALKALPFPTSVPWQRIVNAKSMISLRGNLDETLIQRKLLEAEGIVFDGERIDFKKYLWKPDEKSIILCQNIGGESTWK